MTIRLPFVSVFAAAFIAVGASAAQASAEACVFQEYAPSAAAPYIADAVLDYGTYSYLGGAQLFVPAREGLTQEWLAARVQQALDQNAARRDQGSNAACTGPGVKNVKVSVVSGGTGFWVQLIGRDYEDSQRLVRWAKRIVSQQHQTRLTSR